MRKEDRSPRKLELNRETLRELENRDLERAAGGVATTLCTNNVICNLTYQPRCF